MQIIFIPESPCTGRKQTANKLPMPSTIVMAAPSTKHGVQFRAELNSSCGLTLDGVEAGLRVADALDRRDGSAIQTAHRRQARVDAARLHLACSQEEACHSPTCWQPALQAAEGPGLVITKWRVTHEAVDTLHELRSWLNALQLDWWSQFYSPGAGFYCACRRLAHRWQGPPWKPPPRRRRILPHRTRPSCPAPAKSKRQDHQCMVHESTREPSDTLQVDA